MKLITKIKTIALAVSLTLPASYLQAKTFDPDLATKLATSDFSTLHQVIVTFDQNAAPSAIQLDELNALGINTGVSMKNLPIVGVLATKTQVDAIYARQDVVSVWHNDPLTLENHESTKVSGVLDLRADQDLRKNGIPYSGRGVAVVVNDSGVDGNHGDLMFPSHVVQNVLAQTNLNSFSGILPITYQENVANTDIGGGHGTHVAGTVGGIGAMSSGKHAGVAPGADIIGYGSGAGLFILDTIGGFDYALTHQYQYNIRVISNSFGNTSEIGMDFQPDDPTNIATKTLADNGIITVFSAGNSGPGEGSITGNFKKAPWVITVAAGDKNGQLADFSSRGVKNGQPQEVTINGETFTWEDRPTVTAPGVDVISARASTSSLGGLSAQDDIDMVEPQNLAFYTVSSGTSMAAPHVSGIVALMMEANSSLQWQDIKRILQNTATPMTGRESWEVGAGYVNAHAAIKAIVEGESTFGDTVKLNRDFNAKALIVNGDQGTYSTTFMPVGDSPDTPFYVGEKVSLVIAKAEIETGSAFVLEDPAGNRYGSGIGLAVLGSSVGAVAPGMPGKWKLYSRGIGSISGVSVDPAGVTNGVGAPSTVDVEIKMIETSGFLGLDDVAEHPARTFAEYVVNRQLMDSTSHGFEPDAMLNRGQLADILTFAASVRQSLKGNQSDYNDVDIALAAAVNSATLEGAMLADLDRTDAALMLDSDSSDFGVNDNVSKQELAYSLVQSLGLQAQAQAFDTEQDLTAIVFGQSVTVVDSAQISPELKGYVQQALALGLLKVRIEVQQGPFDLEPSFSAYFEPQSTITRGETAVALSTLDTLR
ncbi:S8 family serine peptidase [uncultured Paraglaciecola sp.]|uniref:S8 family serine peptidase n=1 Tax=uncultured Paraglaciecola sp. TaxID=1765024 RepID=UPI0030DB95C0|tara:strand:- start:55026 stop:57488 length:2463 start_codon:yes stop_codon:yes gene_type:complete